jgi:RNA-directed DNA polymerase
LTSSLLRAVSRHDAIEAAWRVIQENARGSTSLAVRREVDDFAQEAGRRIRSICWRLSRNRFDFGAAKGIRIPKKDPTGRKTGAYRSIVLASLEARIVQRSVLEVVQTLPALSSYINTPYSFGGIRAPKPAGRNDRRDNPSAVPAAIKAVLVAIDDGARYFACADIKSFFTRISKKRVTEVIALAARDPEFVNFFSKAIATELSNMAELRETISDFPIEEVGVAQGNSLSSLLGNIALAKFDLEMNQGDCCCIRYIDDFIILGPSLKATNARLRRSVRLLHELGMELAPDKSSKGASPIDVGFSFLGIDVMPGIIRPSARAQQKFITAVANELNVSKKAFREFKEGKPLLRSNSLIHTLKRVEGIVDGWGKHYWFCNDTPSLERLDAKIADFTREFLGIYSSVRLQLSASNRTFLLGIPALTEQSRRPFSYPAKKQANLTRQQDL